MTRTTRHTLAIIATAVLLLFAAVPVVSADPTPPPAGTPAAPASPGASAAPAPSPAAAVAVITGKVANKTAGGGSVANLQVTLHTLAHQTEGPKLTTTTDKDGNYRFENLATDGTTAYAVGVQYAGIGYGSDFIVFAPGQTSETADIDVYEAGNSASAMQIERAHVIFSEPDLDTQSVSVMEILIISNTSDRAFVAASPDQPTLQMSIPDGAKNLETDPQLEGAINTTSNGFTFNQPLLPGRSQFMYAYEVSYQGGRYDLARSFLYPVQQLSVLVPDKGIKVTSDQLAAQPNVDLGLQGTFVHVLGSNFTAGTKITARLEGLPSPSPLDFLSKLPRWALPAAGGVVLIAIAVAVFLILRRRRKPLDDEELLEEEEDEEEADDFATLEFDDDDLEADYEDDSSREARPDSKSEPTRA